MQIFLSNIANQQVLQVEEQEGGYVPCGDVQMPRLITSQEDSALTFKVVLTDDGENYPIPEGGALSAWYMGASGKGCYTAIDGKDAFRISGNEILVDAIHQMMTNAGGGMFWLILHMSDGRRKTLLKLPYVTASGPDSDSPEAISYYDAFSETLKSLRELMNAMVPDQTLSKENVPADAATVGAAIKTLEKSIDEGCVPAGLGYGESLIMTHYISDLNDNTLLTGYYFFNVNTANRPDSSFGGGFVYMEQFDESIVYQTIWNNSDGSICCRRYYDEQWEEWAWKNPPMTAGVEYKTAELFEGKAVYTKLIDCGAASDGKTVAHGISDVKFLRFSGTLADLPLPFYTSANFSASIRVSNTNVFIAETGYNNKRVTARLWYTKN